jgi:hypothetical protein
MSFLENIFILVFVFSFSDNNFKEKLIRNVKKEVGLVIRRRFVTELGYICYSLLHVTDKDPVTFLSYYIFPFFFKVFSIYVL